jgi:hypothetical protein
VIHMTGASTSEDVATGLMFPIALGFGSDGNLYASVPAFGADDGSGMVVQVSGSAPATPAPASCAPIQETLRPPAPATPMASPVA